MNSKQSAVGVKAQLGLKPSRSKANDAKDPKIIYESTETSLRPFHLASIIAKFEPFGRLTP